MGTIISGFAYSPIDVCAGNAKGYLALPLSSYVYNVFSGAEMVAHFDVETAF
jgi:hypothetical protein